MSSITEIRRIDNSRQWLPFVTTLLIIFLIWIAIWFFRGGSFRLYASVFFGLYALTGQVWISVLLVGIVQNLAFLPLRFIGLKLSTSQEQFEEELENTKSESEQYFLFSEKVKKGDLAIIFFIFSFILNAVAFISAGRIFLIDFYSQKLNPNYLYSFIPYPSYPLKGTIFRFPFFHVNATTAVDWKYIIYFWLFLSIFLALIRLLWRFFKIFFARNKTLLRFRIGYNRLLVTIGGVGLTIIVISAFILRHIPTSLSFVWLVADLTRQNTTMNTITAIGTYITAVHAGLTRQRIASAKARLAGIEEAKISLVARQNIRQSFRNAFYLGLGAFLITNQIPCAFELSVATFEVLYMLSPYTFDKLLVKARPSANLN